MPKCKRCGKSIGFFVSNGLCQECTALEIEERYPGLTKTTSAIKSCFYCGFIRKTSLLSNSTENQNLTNLGFGLTSGSGTTKYQYTDKWSCSKFSFEVFHYNDSRAENCSSFISKEDYEKKCLSGDIDKEKTNIQLILDFTSLKDVMTKGGLVMTTYKCPNCNGMIKLPEAGKVLMCEYCGTPIKPVDIFEKIKSLIQ